MEELLLRALSASLLLAVLAGPLGCFVVWQRMAYFGDTLAHSALLGVAFSLILHVPVGPGVLLCALLIALLLAWLHQNTTLPSDTILGILAHTALAAGVLVLGFVSHAHIDWLAYLFGDLLSVSWQDVQRMAVVSAAVLLIVLLNWRKLLIIAVDPELAEVDGLKVGRLRVLLLLLMAATIAIAIQVVGALLVTALLIIPASTARNLAHSPRQMAFIACTVAALASVTGIAASYSVDVSVGPAIVMAAFLMFVISLALRAR